MIKLQTLVLVEEILEISQKKKVGANFDPFSENFGGNLIKRQLKKIIRDISRSVQKRAVNIPWDFVFPAFRYVATDFRPEMQEKNKTKHVKMFLSYKPWKMLTK